MPGAQRRLFGPMTAAAFRRDRDLRASGYGLFVWGTVNLLVTMPGIAAMLGRPWPGWMAVALPVALFVAGLGVAGICDHRVEKMCGPADPRPVVDARRLWSALLLAAVALSVALAVAGGALAVPLVWMALVGAGYLAWGASTIPEFRLLGIGLLAAVVAEAAFGAAAEGRVGLAIWAVAMGFAWFPLGAWINHRYLHRRPLAVPIQEA